MIDPEPDDDEVGEATGSPIFSTLKLIWCAVYLALPLPFGI